MMTDVNIQRVLGKIDKLPSLPFIVSTLNDLIRNPNTSASDIHKVIMKDQALSARVLKLVNSAFYGFSERISSISHAIVILGFNTVKNVALTASVLNMFGGSETKDGENFDRKAFWIHSLAVAGTAKLIASRVRLPSAEDIFVAGLMHDIGKLVLDQFVHEQFVEVLKVVKEKNIHIKEAENEVLDGVNHCQVGAWLATRWKLPTALVQMIGFHHRPALDDQFLKPVSCVHLADILVRTLGIGNGGDNTVPQICPEAWEALGLSFDDLSAIFTAMEDEIADAEQLIAEG
jgi:putative nucleotidyltransferase with HDIG domain